MVHLHLFLSNSHTLCNPLYCFLIVRVCFFNSLPTDEYSIFLMIGSFFNSPFSGKTSSLVRNSYLSVIYDHKTETSAVSLSNSHWSLLASVIKYVYFVITVI